MVPDFFYINNRMTAPLEVFLREFDSYDDFEKHFSEEFLNEDDLLYKYDKKASVVSFDAHLNHSYVGNIFWDESKNQWIVQEQYVRKTSKGKVISRTGIIERFIEK